MTLSSGCQASILVRSATRVFVISDLHLGGEPAMMSRPALLAEFIDGLPARLAADETLELVINGDFIDFLAITPFASFTTNPVEAVGKLRSVVDAPSPFASVFDALRRHVAAGHQLVVMVGNHDLELALPAVQDALRDCLCAPAGTLRFVDDGRAYRIGNALVEHGNTYDGANANDWNGVRHLASAQSRGSEPQADVQVSAGSQIVHKIVNTLKERYPFLPLIQPEGELLVLLMLQFEPELRSDIKKIAQLLKAKKLAEQLPKHGKTAIAAAGSEDEGLEAALRDIFSEEYALLNATNQPISALDDWIDSWHRTKKTSLSYMLEHDVPIPLDRLNKIRLGITKIVDADQSCLISGETQQYCAEGERMLKAIKGLQVVVMGHTHLPRRQDYGQGVYINSGTWIDRFTVPPEVLQDETCKELTSFLRKLLRPGGIKPMPPNFADLSVAVDGTVRHAELHAYESTLP